MLDAVGWLGEHLVYWVPILPAILLLFAIGWVRSGRASTLRPGRLSGLLRMVPGMRSILDLAQTADFADLLALMVEHGVPLDEAIGLAAEATGSPRLRASAAAVAERLRRGEPADEAASGPGGLPPMLCWVIATSGPMRAARAGAAARRRDLSELAPRGRPRRSRPLLPSVLLCTVGAVAGVIYVVAVFTPVVALWRELALPGSD